MLKKMRQSWYDKSVEMYGVEESAKMWAYASDPVTEYVSSTRNCCNLFNNEVPCKRCGGYGRTAITKKHSDEPDYDTMLCLKCWDEWSWSGGQWGSYLLEKHGYTSSHKKWTTAFNEFCNVVPGTPVSSK